MQELEQAQVELEGYRLSAAQQRIWQLEPGSSNGEHRPQVYRTQCAVLLEGELDHARLRTALKQTVQQHEILRTVFQQLPGMAQPLQVIRERAELNYREEDVAELAAEARRARLEEIYEEHGHIGFEL